MPTTNPPRNEIGVPRRTTEVLDSLDKLLTGFKVNTPGAKSLLSEARVGLAERPKHIARAFVVMQSCLSVGMDTLVFPERQPQFIILCTATFMQESNGKRLARGTVNPDGLTFDLGDKQLNSSHYPNAEQHAYLATDYYRSAAEALKLMEERIARGKHPLSPWVGFTKNRYQPWWEVCEDAAQFLERDDKPRVL